MTSASEGIWSAPGRVEFIGGHTDYNGGCVLPFAINLRTTVAASRRDDGVLSARSRQWSGTYTMPLDSLRPGSAAGWAAYVAGTVWALREAGHQIGGLNLVVDSTVPAGSGLSSSAALECAVATAATDLYEVDVSPTALARLAQQAENDFVGVPCGLMDQMVAMTATAGHALFFDTRTAATEQIPFDPAAADLAVMVIDTRFHHSLADGQYAARRGECERAATELGVAYLCDLSADDLEAATAGLADASIARRVRHVVTENERVRRSAAYLRDGKPADVGQLLTDSHRSLRDDFEVSCAQLDLAVDVALEGGALGARMTGGGFGGSAVALLAESAVEPAREAILTAFRRHAFTEPEMWVANPSRGAGREPD